MTWIFWLFIVGPFAWNSASGQGQRVAPGVPPQHYQQPSVPPQQVHHQQVPVHHQQVPVQHQQPPQQHYQQQQVHQAPPVHQQPPVQHHQVPQQQHVPHQQPHHDHHAPQQLLNTANIAHEKEHIAEHLDVPMDTSKMTDQELQFHYFKMHDADNNNKLDGCELIKSLIHWHDQGHKDAAQTGHEGTVGDKLFKDDELVQLIDPILQMDDANGDGYIDYPEFIQAQQKTANANHQ